MTRSRSLLFLAICMLLPSLAGAAPLPQSAESELVVVTKVAEPFVMRNDAGEWSGLTIELWESVANQLDRPYRLVERDLAGLFADVESGKADLALAALTMTPEREKVVDFSHTVLTSGLGIAVNNDGGGRWGAVVSALFSMEFLRAISALGVVLLVIGALVWIFERRHNKEEFGGSIARGLVEGFWWSAVTMTTVGYGDRSPRTLGGRAVGLVWMFASIILISGFTAAIASSLTVSQLDSRIQDADDLAGVRIGSITDSTSVEWLEERRLSYRGFDSPAAALAALAQGDLDAVVHDAPMLEYLASGEFAGDVHVLPVRLERQDYALAVPQGSLLLEPLNQALLDVLGTPLWEEALERYLGK